MASLTTEAITIGNNTGIQVDVQRSNDYIILCKKNFERILDVVKQLEGHITTLECENNTIDKLQKENAELRVDRFTTAPITKNPTTSNPHDHKSNIMKGGIAGENHGNQQMSWFVNWHYPSERIQFLLATFRGIVEGSNSDIQDGSIINITTDPLTDEEVTHLLISVSFSCLNEILTPINSNDFRTVPNSDFLIVVSKSRASQKQVLIKFNVTDAANRVTALKEMYDGALLIKEIELGQPYVVRDTP